MILLQPKDINEQKSDDLLERKARREEDLWEPGWGMKGQASLSSSRVTRSAL